MNTKSRQHAVWMIVLGVIVICVHKAWRFYLRDVAGLDPLADYWRYETLSTMTRAIGALVAVLACWWGLADARRHFGPGALRPALVMIAGVRAQPSQSRKPIRRHGETLICRW